MGPHEEFDEPITAGELLARLEKDPEYVRMRREQAELAERNRAEFAALEAPILADLRRVGVQVATIGDARALQAFLPLSPEAVSVVLDWLPRAPLLPQESLVRLLAAARDPFDGTALADLFDKTESSGLRWVIANTIDVANPTGIGRWLADRLLGARTGDSTGGLFKALRRQADKQTILSVARKLLEADPGLAAPVLGKLGTPDDVAVLRRMADRTDGADQRKVNSAIAKIVARHRQS